MDTKQAIRLLKNYGGCIVTDQEGIIRLNSDSLIKLLNQQEEYAELGRLALTTRATVCSNRDFIKNRVRACEKHCTNYLHCKLRAELLVGEK